MTNILGYLNCLPNDVLSLLFLSFTDEELIFTISKLFPSITKFEARTGKTLWKTLWTTNISSMSPVPSNIAEKYIEIMTDYINKKDYKDECGSLIDSLVANRCDILLTSIPNYHSYDFEIEQSAAKSGCEELVYKLLHNASPFYHVRALTGAAGAGHINLVKSIIQRVKSLSPYDQLPYDYNYALVCAAIDNHKDIMELLISEGANDYGGVMGNAARQGYKDIVEWMLKLGATQYSWALEMAAAGGHKDIIELMRQYGASSSSYAVREAVRGGHMEIVQLLLTYPTNNELDYGEILIAAANGKNLDVVKFMANKVSLVYKEDPAKISIICNSTMQLSNNIEIVELMVQLGANNYENTMKFAAYRGNILIVKRMVDLGAKNYDETMEEAAKGASIEVVKMMIDLGAKNYTQCIYSAVYGSGKLRKRIELLDFLMEKVDHEIIDYEIALIHSLRSYENEIQLVKYVLEKSQGRIKNYDKAIGEARWRSFNEAVTLINLYMARSSV
jgi:ankyrin repeat protein